MGWNSLVLRALVGASVLVGALAAPASADTSTTTLVVGIDGSGAGAALAAAGVDVTDAADGLDAVRVEVPTRRAAAARAALAAAPGIDFVEADAPVAAMRTPSDPYWSYQWGPRQVSAPAAWDVTTGASGVVVAVLDTGVTPGPEFDGKLLPGIDFVNGDSDATDDDAKRHGTAVAAVAAADGDDGGVAGMCWTCSVLPVKVLGADGSGSSYDIARGITWATDRGADVVVMSLGGTGTSRTLQDATAYARSKGVVLVAAAGNSGSTTPNYPAAYPGVIGVAGSTSTDGRYSWSNHGSWVDVAAPGCNGAPLASGGYGDFCGTSSATPLTAGAAALAVALGASGAVVEDALRSTAVPVGSWVERGRIDAAAMLAAVEVALAGSTSSDGTDGTGSTGGTGGDTTTPEPDPDPEPEPEPDPEPQPEDGSSPAVERTAGTDRVATSIALADRAFPDGAERIVIGRSDAYADALAAAPLAASLGAPVVLSPSSSLRADVTALIDRLGVSEAVLVGGTGALGTGVEDDLRAEGVRVRRVAGANRFDTARLIAAEIGGTDAYLVEGVNASSSRGWPDAVAVSGLAALQRRPILLTTSQVLPAETRAALQQLGTRSVTIVGGTAAVSASVAAAASELASVTRVSGATRYDTSTKLAELAVAAGADDSAVWLATGRSFPDALAAGAAAARSGAVLILVDGTDLKGSPEPLRWLDNRSDLRTVVLVGGTSSLSSVVEATISGL